MKTVLKLVPIRLRLPARPARPGFAHSRFCGTHGASDNSVPLRTSLYLPTLSYGIILLMNALHPDVHASLKGLSQALGITCRYLSQTRFLLSIPVCFENVTWQISFTRAGASHTCADIVVPDEHFAPLLRSEKVLAACLIAHDVQHRGLTNYVEELLAW